MRNLVELDSFRSLEWQANILARTGLQAGPPETGGCFIMPSPYGAELRCIAAIGDGWDHVSVTTDELRCPRWGEMDYVKRLFFLDEETAFQLHVPRAEHISHHPYCLHIWRPHGIEIPRPPMWMVA